MSAQVDRAGLCGQVPAEAKEGQGLSTRGPAGDQHAGGGAQSSATHRHG